MAPLINSLDDRRMSARFDIVGNLRGALTLDEPTRVLHLSAAGALLESRLPVPIGPLTIALANEHGSTQPIPARVQHVRRANEDSDVSPYLISIVFLGDATSCLEALANR